LRLGGRLGLTAWLTLIALALAVPSGVVRAQGTAADGPTVCRIGVDIEDLYDFDPAHETFGGILWLWSLCPSADPAPLATIVCRTALPGLQLGEVRATRSAIAPIAPHLRPTRRGSLLMAWRLTPAFGIWRTGRTRRQAR
jgi:hypothetical protein